MEFEVNGKKIHVREPLGKHQKAYMKKVAALNYDNGTTLVELMEFRDNLLSELSGLSQDEIDEMTALDKKKIFKEIESRFVLFESSKAAEDAKK